MFGKLKEKLKNWTERLSKSAEEKEEVKEVPEPKSKKKKNSEEVLVQKKEDEEEIEIPEEKESENYEKELDALEKKAKEVEKELEKLKREREEVEEEKPSKKEIAKKKDKKHVEKTEPNPGEEGFFKKITSKINKVKISEKEFEIYEEELETLLIENNVAIEVVEKIIKELKENVVGKELLKKEVESEITEQFKEIIRRILIEPFDLAEKIKEKMRDQSKEPYVIIFCGINGTGKTTTIAKVAESLKKKEISCVIAAADTFRAASIEQIKTHGERLGIKVIATEYGADPASVGFDAIQYAKKNSVNCVLIDTAGRMHTSKNLLKEIEKISRVCKPDTKIFVGESLTGNDIIEQVKSFDWAIGIDGVILTKADIDDKGGTALSVGYITKKPILYLGTGQEYDNIEVFDKEKFIKTLGL